MLTRDEFRVKAMDEFNASEDYDLKDEYDEHIKPLVGQVMDKADALGLPMFCMALPSSTKSDNGWGVDVCGGVTSLPKRNNVLLQAAKMLVMENGEGHEAAISMLYAHFQTFCGMWEAGTDGLVSGLSGIVEELGEIHTALNAATSHDCPNCPVPDCDRREGEYTRPNSSRLIELFRQGEAGGYPCDDGAEEAPEAAAPDTTG